MRRFLFPLLTIALLTSTTGCSVGMALLQRMPARRAAATEKLVQVAEFHEARGDFAEAEATYRRALKDAPGNTDLQERLTAVTELKRRQQGQKSDALDQLDGPLSILAANRRRRDEVLAGKSGPIRSASYGELRKAKPESEARGRRSDEVESQNADEELVGRQSPIL
ncbi:MAG: tetratricopeptide repeat protein [Planctomycetia bacterium]